MIIPWVYLLVLVAIIAVKKMRLMIEKTCAPLFVTMYLVGTLVTKSTIINPSLHLFSIFFGNMVKSTTPRSQNTCVKQWKRLFAKKSLRSSSISKQSRSSTKSLPCSSSLICPNCCTNVKKTGYSRCRYCLDGRKIADFIERLSDHQEATEAACNKQQTLTQMLRWLQLEI